MPEFKNPEFLKARADEARARAAAADDVLVKAAFIRLAESFDQLREAIEKRQAPQSN
ncbi:MAG: hypothetical protein ACYC1L_13790 [Alphaproteobacteria bacterium]